MLLQAEQMHKMVDIGILSENSSHYVSCSVCNKSYFFGQFEISLVLNGTTPKIEHRKLGP